MSTENVRIYLIAGLGGLDSSFQPLIDFVKRIAPDSPLMVGVWDNGSFLDSVVQDMRRNDNFKFMLIGHSFGGWRAIELADGHFGDVPKIDRLVALDPKPHDFWKWIQMDLYKFPVPSHIGKATSIHGGFGCGFELAEDAVSVHLDIPHPSFPGNADCQELIGVQIAELAGDA